MTGARGEKRPVVVLADDGAPASDVAWAWLVGYRWEGWELQAFWALPWSRDVALSLVSVDDGNTDVENALKVAAAALPAGIWPAKVVRLRRELVEFVQANQIDLVVMGTRGMPGWTRMRVGSAVCALVKDGSANLLIAHVPGHERDGAR